MGLEAVKEEIIRNSKEQESAMLAEARRESAIIAKESEKKISEMREKSEADTKKLTDSIKRQALSSAEMEGKKMILDAKKQVIDGVFAEAGKMLEALDDKKREAYIKKLAERAKKEMSIGRVYCNKRDIKFIREFSTEPAGMICGLIAENSDGTIRIDYSFETMLESIKESEMQSINKMLFV